MSRCVVSTQLFRIQIEIAISRRRQNYFFLFLASAASKAFINGSELEFRLFIEANISPFGSTSVITLL